MEACLVVDDDDGQRTLTRLVVETTGLFQVVAEASNGRQAIERAVELQPGLVLLDLDMPVMNGVAALPGLLAAAPRATVVVFSMTSEPAQLEAARRAGAHGFLDKAMPNDGLAAAIATLARR
jgi:DNA-binding NarL/FixJ family response regulator